MQRLASLRLTLLIVALLGVAVLLRHAAGMAGEWPIAVPLFLLAGNLAAAVISNPVFRARTALLVFHLALIAIAALVGTGRLSHLQGQVEVSVGETFDGVLTQTESGPWHAGRLQDVSFTNLGFSIGYSAGLKRNETRNEVSWRDDEGRMRNAVIGDQQPLVLHGYRFYTSPNKGYAPQFLWQPVQGAAVRGTIHLPSFPMHEHGQSLDWTPPGAATKLWTMLQLEEPVHDPSQAWQFRLPSNHKLVMRAGEQRHELKPGESLELKEGTLRYEGLTTWMGYKVFYDWTLPWLLAAALLAVISLGWHACEKFSRERWDA